MNEVDERLLQPRCLEHQNAYVAPDHVHTCDQPHEHWKEGDNEHHCPTCDRWWVKH